MSIQSMILSTLSQEMRIRVSRFIQKGAMILISDLGAEVRANGVLLLTIPMQSIYEGGCF